MFSMLFYAASFARRVVRDGSIWRPEYQGVFPLLKLNPVS